ncbi:hypothetical protein [Chryseobacterium gossypii]|uniref:hypothetical protein n=1 Tax=Chryseobacterium gossypii TaxID=3231602 RepID=UPI00352464D5
MGTEETFLEAPVMKNNKVNFILVAYKDGNKVFFKRKDEKTSKQFFSALVFNDRKKLSKATLNSPLGANAKGNCITVTTTWTWTNETTGQVEYITSTSETYCIPSGPQLPCQSIYEDGDCGSSTGGGGSGGGYPYTPEIEQFVDNCAKVKSLTTNTTFKSNIQNLEGKTGLKTETGYIQRTDGSYTYMDTAGQTDNSNTLSLPRPDLPENQNIISYMHTHVNDYTYTDTNGTEITRMGIKMFSPADIAYFMDMLKNAQNTGRPLIDVYAVMVTSKGNYQIRFTGNQYQIKSFTSQQIKDFSDQYRIIMAKSSDLELSFLNFLSEKMNVKAINLYRMDSNGTNYEIKLNDDKISKSTTGCPG